jgi:hypothetical protein
VLDASLVKIGSTYYMFYQGNTADQNNSALGVATSTDLTTWTKDADNPIARGANSGEWDFAWNEGPRLFQLSTGEWLMAYMGYQGTTGTKNIGLTTFKPTRLWVEVPSIASSSTATIYVYYGNSGASDVSSGANTFTFFDDFTSGLPFSQWNNAGSFTAATVSGENTAAKYAANTNTNYYMYSNSSFSPPFVVECRAAAGVDWAAEDSWIFRLDLTGAGGGIVNAILTGFSGGSGATTAYLMRFSGGVASHNVNEARDLDAAVWTTLTLRVPASGVITALYNDGYRSLATASTTPPADPLYVQLNTARGASTSDYASYFDKVWVRKYAATEPSSSVGNEEADPSLSYQPRPGVAVGGVFMV